MILAHGIPMSRNPGLDQAEGLRRMLTPVVTRRISFLSAIPPGQKNAILLNLAAALVQMGSDVHLLDASQSAQGISAKAQLQVCLSDVALQKAELALALHEQGQGIHLIKLSREPLNQLAEQPLALESLSKTLRELSPETGFCLVDTHLSNDNPFLLPELAEGDVVVLATVSADSIKAAYSQIKALHAQLGRRPYQVLMVGATPQQAKLIQQNMNQAANLYLAVPLTSLGSIPVDEYLLRAVQLGRSVIEAFPMAGASIAFRAIAGQLATKTLGVTTPTPALSSHSAKIGV
jgi:flagellar biosynthesis protein FlhG